MEIIEIPPEDVPLGFVPDDYSPDNPTDSVTFDDGIIPLGQNPKMGVEAPVGAGIAAAGAVAALGTAAALKKRKK